MPSLMPAAIAEQQSKVLAGQLSTGGPLDPRRYKLQLETLVAALPGTRLTRPVPSRLRSAAALEEADIADLTAAGARRHADLVSETGDAHGHGASAHHMAVHRWRQEARRAANFRPPSRRKARRRARFPEPIAAPQREAQTRPASGSPDRGLGRHSAMFWHEGEQWIVEQRRVPISLWASR
jgi:hypothetical protein